ncbi:MAG: hypothetical protein SVW02_01380 [Candidatus Nanohaloarchaea archaeon]|nr:hypothetical protein [Candidatus Nanohaloarchaea archaeon]
MVGRRHVLAVLVLAVAVPMFAATGAAQLQQSFNSTYDWNNSPNCEAVRAIAENLGFSSALDGSEVIGSV